MPAHNKNVLRTMLENEQEFSEMLDSLSNNDYVYGWDEGEAPIGYDKK